MAKGKKRTNTKRVSNKRRTNKKMRRGGCGCAQKGGFGAASMQPIPVRYYYAGNSYDNDPNSPSPAMSGRNYVATGGRRKSMKKMRGGVSVDPILGAGNANLSFGTTPGAFSGAATFHAGTVQNPSPTSNPGLNWNGSSSYV